MDTAIRIDCSSLSKGVHYCYPTRSELQGGVDLVREHPTEAFRYATGHPRLQQRGQHAGLILSTRGFWAFAPCTPYVARLAGEADAAVPIQGTEDPSNLDNSARKVNCRRHVDPRARTVTQRAHTVIPRGGSALKGQRTSQFDDNDHIKHFIITSRRQPLSLI